MSRRAWSYDLKLNNCLMRVHVNRSSCRVENSLAVPGLSQQLHVSKLSGPTARTARPVIAVFVEGFVFFLKCVYKMYFKFKC